MTVLKLLINYTLLIMNLFFIICGYTSIIFALITQLPQIFTMIKHKSGKNISFIYLALILIDCILYIIYGIGFLIDNNYDGIPIIITGTIPFIITNIILLIKIYFTRTKRIIKKKIDVLNRLKITLMFRRLMHKDISDFISHRFRK